MLLVSTKCATIYVVGVGVCVYDVWEKEQGGRSQESSLLNRK